MNIQGANFLSLLSGSESLGNVQQGLLSATGDQAGFASALMQQLGLLQGNSAAGASSGAPDLAAIQDWVKANAGGDAQQGLQNFAALFGKDLPVSGKINQDIDLEDTLQTLADVLQQLQQLDPGTETLTEVSSSADLVSDAAAQQALQAAEQDSMDIVASQNSPLALPVPVLLPGQEPVGELGEGDQLSGLLPGAKKPASALLSGNAFDQASLATAKPDDSGQEFDRSISAMLANDGAGSKPQSDKSILDFKVDNLASQDGSQLDGNKALPGVAAEIAKLNNVVRGQGAATQSELARPFGDPAWNKELGEKLIWMHKQSIPSVELRLNPEHLGPVLVKIDVSHDQASVAFTAQHLAVKEALEAAIPKLREMLGGQQLNLADVNVSQQQSDQRQPAREFFQMASDQNRSRRSDADNLSNGPANEAQDIVDEIEAGRAVASNGLLSLFA